MYKLLLADVGAAGALELDRCSVDGSCVRALEGGPSQPQTRVDRRRPGSKHHLIVDANGVPLQVTVTGENRNDVTQLLSLVDAFPPIRGSGPATH